MMERFIAVYIRVSSKQQDIRSQEPDLRQWLQAYANDQPVKWFKDKASGKTMDRPGWNRLEPAIDAGKVTKVLIWRLDRLGRTASGLTQLFDKLQQKQIGLVSLRDGLDLTTPSGRLMANVLASVAAYENEVRGERVRAGQERAKSAGKTWGGSKAGVPKQLNPEQIATIQQLHREGHSKAAIARAVQVSRPTIYRVLEHAGIT